MLRLAISQLVKTAEHSWGLWSQEVKSDVYVIVGFHFFGKFLDDLADFTAVCELEPGVCRPFLVTSVLEGPCLAELFARLNDKLVTERLFNKLSLIFLLIHLTFLNHF